ncbi:iron complex transport system substrate-binding protein [Herbihabitans rhizosphaerae]|uniref:Iron complex transport system substrate-binding protein n=1 Tax=Herbihabitans rhizosphaerae TaxID=1872711 RepID=A0A4Q7KYR4_9PSEU|nr:iron-siderophore ABC transporter substrate-binding protein [Herbihabitans rhizosphaerae]RZS41201.1 iron complex transport system substrate-binding protein [Herbihabitans rhizosphaerae]
MASTRRRWHASVLVATASCLVLTACSSTETPQAASSSCGQVADNSAGFPRTVKHVMGEAKIDKPPKRVAALDTSYVDAALALDTEVIAFTKYRGFGDKLPDYLAADAAKCGTNAKAVGELAAPDVEQIYALKPDLIVSAKIRHEKYYQQFASSAPTVFSQTTGASWKDNIRLLGKALGKEQLADKRIADYESRARRLGEAIKTKNGGKAPTVTLARFVAGEQTARLYTSESYAGIVMRDIGLPRPPGQPDRTDKVNVDVSQEEILKLDADRVFVGVYDDDARKGAEVKSRFAANPLWGKLTGKVSDVNDTTWITSVSLQGAHAIMDDLAKLFGVDPMK